MAVYEVVCPVSDTGVGIPKEDLTRIFNKFEQVKRDQKELYHKLGKVKGVGLGLAIAKGIIEAHGGKIWVDSELNKQTTFTFTIPI